MGRVRHLDVRMLRLQDQQRRRVLEVVKVLGTANPADLVTKHASKELVDKYATFWEFEVVGSLAATTARLHSAAESGPQALALAARRRTGLGKVGEGSVEQPDLE